MIRPRSGLLAMLLGVLGALPLFAAPAVFTGTLSGGAEVPPNASPGTGPVTVSFDASSGLMTLAVSFEGLLGTTTAAHIHCCVGGPGANAGVATMVPSFPAFPVGVSGGIYANTFDMTVPGSYNPAFLGNHGGDPAAALAALLAAMGRGGAYFNLHTQLFPGGEIRADLFEQPIFANGFE